jgi:hypothetical protein
LFTRFTRLGLVRRQSRQGFEAISAVEKMAGVTRPRGGKGHGEVAELDMERRDKQTKSLGNG